MIANNSPKVNKQLLEKHNISKKNDGLKMTSHDTQSHPQHGRTISEKICPDFFEPHVIISDHII